MVSRSPSQAGDVNAAALIKLGFARSRDAPEVLHGQRCHRRFGIAQQFAAKSGHIVPLHSAVRVKVSAVCGRRDEASADDEATEPFFGFTLSGVGGKERV